MKKNLQLKFFTLLFAFYFFGSVLIMENALFSRAQEGNLTWNFDEGDTFGYDYLDYTEEMKKEGTITLEILGFSEKEGESLEYGVEFNYTLEEKIIEFQGVTKDADPLISSEIYYSQSGRTVSNLLVSQEYLDENMTAEMINQSIQYQKLVWGFRLLNMGEGCYNEDVLEYILDEVELYNIDIEMHDYGYRMSYSGEDNNNEQCDLLEEIKYTKKGVLEIYHSKVDENEYKVTFTKKSIPAFPSEMFVILSMLGISLSILPRTKKIKRS